MITDISNDIPQSLMAEYSTWFKTNSKSIRLASLGKASYVNVTIQGGGYWRWRTLCSCHGWFTPHNSLDGTELTLKVIEFDSKLKALDIRFREKKTRYYNKLENGQKKRTKRVVCIMHTTTIELFLQQYYVKYEDIEVSYDRGSKYFPLSQGLHMFSGALPICPKATRLLNEKELVAKFMKIKNLEIYETNELPLVQQNLFDHSEYNVL